MDHQTSRMTTQPPYVPGPDEPARAYQLTPAERVQAQQYAPPTPPPRKSRAGLVGATVAVLAVLLAGAGGVYAWQQGVFGSTTETPTDAGPPMSELVTACQEAVKRELKSPGSAKFSEEDASGGPTYYRVEGVVDSQNGFGAVLRNRYTCNAIREASWRTLGVEFSDWP